MNGCSKVAIFGWLAAVCLPAAAQLVVEGTSVDDLGGGQVRGTVSREHIVNGGTVIFRSIIGGAPSSSDLTWWLDGSEILREGDDAPGLPGLTLIPLSGVTGNSVDVLHVSFLNGAPANSDIALFLGTDLLAREGDLVPGTGDMDRYSGAPNIDDLAVQGHRIAFSWNLEDASTALSTGKTLFKASASDVAEVARTGQSAPGLPSNYLFDSFRDISLSPGNQLAFIGTTVQSGARGAPIEGAWQTSFGTSPSLVVQTGELGPGNIGPLDSIQDITFAGGDDIAIQATIAPSPSASNAVWIAGGGSSVVKSGDLIEGMTLNFVTRLAANPNKRMAFFCHFNTFVGLCLADPIQGVEIVIAEGDPAPQIGGGVTIGTLRTQPALNRFDQIAFYALLAGPGVDFSNDEALFFRHADGSLSLVAREGETYDLGPAGVATIHAEAASPSALRYRDNGANSDRFGIYDGQQSPMTEVGTLVLWANFLGMQEFEAILRTTPDPEGIFWDSFDGY
ncbi:MAG: hypothetical protein DHS20C11_15990 [Lysobacteraceae bacterium]|nr:MAG: hypothetical protein DHS20C11_15990 [Xanthomonadaceae bacterium]